MNEMINKKEKCHMTYEEWHREVEICAILLTQGTEILAGCPLRKWYREGLQPWRAAIRAQRKNWEMTL